MNAHMESRSACEKEQRRRFEKLDVKVNAVHLHASDFITVISVEINDNICDVHYYPATGRYSVPGAGEHQFDSAWVAAKIAGKITKTMQFAQAMSVERKF